MKSKLINGTRILVLGGLFCAIPAVGFTQTATQSMPSSAQPDNTKQNKAEQPTAERQTNDAADLDLTKNVRHALTQDKSLSTYAHNVKVIAQDGKVTLKGPVRSEEEKQAIGAKAAEVAGQGNVVNELTIAPDKDK